MGAGAQELKHGDGKSVFAGAGAGTNDGTSKSRSLNCSTRDRTVGPDVNAQVCMDNVFFQTRLHTDPMSKVSMLTENAVDHAHAPTQFKRVPV